MLSHLPLIFVHSGAISARLEFQSWLVIGLLNGVPPLLVLVILGWPGTVAQAGFEWLLL